MKESKLRNVMENIEKMGDPWERCGAGGRSNRR
jgi:hypothetical protein